MVYLAAITSGSSMVAFDCLRGPAELIDHRRGGWLNSCGGSSTPSDTLLALIDDCLEAS